MDSLLANYASSDEEENQRQNSVSCSKPNSSLSLFSSLPHPESSSLSSSLTQFKHQSSTPIIHHNNNNNNVKADEDDPKPSSKSSSSLFSLLPQPKTQALQQPVSNISSLDPTPKRVVQFRPPINPTYVKPSDLDDEDDEDEGEKEKKRRKESEFLSQSSSVKSFLSSIPAPRNSSTFGVLPSAAGSGRRSIIETKAPATSSGGSFGTQNDQNNDQSHGGISANYAMGSDENGGNYVNFGSYESGINQYICQNVNTGDDGSSYGSYESYGSYGSYDDYGQHGNNWSDDQATAVPERTGPSESALRVPGKRGRKDIPTEVIEVKQDELTKNRPREDQVKLTGIAFGPSYQPAASTKGKPTKLHKRKHQIGSLYFDMKQKEMELTERRAKGFLTKAQTQAKYGW